MERCNAKLQRSACQKSLFAPLSYEFLNSKEFKNSFD